MAEQIYKRVCRVIGEYAGIDPDSISPGQSLGQAQRHNFYASAKTAPLGLDSLDLLELAMRLEEEFGISIDDYEVDGAPLNHVGGLVAFVTGKVDSKQQPSFIAANRAFSEITRNLVDAIATAEPANDASSARSIGETAPYEWPIPVAATSGISVSSSDVLDLTADMKVTNSGVFGIAFVGSSGVASGGGGGSASNSMDKRSEWQKARDVLLAAGLKPEELLVREWNWLQRRDEERRWDDWMKNQTQSAVRTVFGG